MQLRASPAGAYVTGDAGLCEVAGKLKVPMREQSGSGIRWRDTKGRPLSCEEKLKVLEENLAEVRQVCQDAFEDAVLMECDEAQIREVFLAVVGSLRNPFADRSAASSGESAAAPGASAEDSAASSPAPSHGHRRRS